jgi:hypothetical protein
MKSHTKIKQDPLISRDFKLLQGGHFPNWGKFEKEVKRYILDI